MRRWFPLIEWVVGEAPVACLVLLGVVSTRLHVIGERLLVYGLLFCARQGSLITVALQVVVEAPVTRIIFVMVRLLLR